MDLLPQARTNTEALLKLLTVATVAVLLLYDYAFRIPSLPAGSPRTISRGNYPIVGALAFFTQRWDLFRRESRMGKGTAFSMNVGKEHIIGITSAETALQMFNSGHLDLHAGQSFLFGAGPVVKGETDDATSFASYLAKRFTFLMRKEKLRKALPIIVEDVKSVFQELASSSSSVINPFESIYELVFLLTLRTTGCREIAEDPARRLKTLRRFNAIEKSFKPSTVIFPWLPTPSKAVRTVKGAQLFFDFKGIVDCRRAKGVREDDPLQHLIDEGDDPERIVAFVLAALFAGQLNSGVSAANVIYCLATHPEWQDKARKEVEDVTHRHSDGEGRTLVEQLSHLQADVWETEFTTLDNILSESIRLQFPGSAIRKNTSGRPVELGEVTVPPDAFTVYNFRETHVDPTIYTDPDRFDPSRFEPGRAEHRKSPMAFVGWGKGRHPCLGMRFAKLEVAVITAFFLAFFDVFASIDEKGTPLAAGDPKLVPFDNNAIGSHRPYKPVYVRLKKRE